jgi:hypothetical protein
MMAKRKSNDEKEANFNLHGGDRKQKSAAEILIVLQTNPK